MRKAQNYNQGFIEGYYTGFIKGKSETDTRAFIAGYEKCLKYIYLDHSDMVFLKVVETSEDIRN